MSTANEATLAEVLAELRALRRSVDRAAVLSSLGAGNMPPRLREELRDNLIGRLAADLLADAREEDGDGSAG